MTAPVIATGAATTAPAPVATFTAGEVIAASAVPAAQTMLMEGFVSQTQVLRALLISQIAETWKGLGSWGSEGVERFVESAGPIITAARELMTILTAEHTAAQISLARDGVLDLAPVETDDIDASVSLRGVDDDTLWRRPFLTTWTALANGKPLIEALALGERRATSIATTEVQLAKTHTARDVMADNREVVGYRRVLTGRASCALCLLVSTQRYHKADLLPIHPGCDCGVEPIVGTSDPGQVIDPELAEQLHEIIRADLGEKYVDAGGRKGLEDYRDIIVTHEHGEIGPVLGVRGHDFTGMADLP